MLAKRIATNEIFAIKILNKKAVLQKGELDHVRSERNVLVGNLKHPFLVSMHYSFQTGGGCERVGWGGSVWLVYPAGCRDARRK